MQFALGNQRLCSLITITATITVTVTTNTDLTIIITMSPTDNIVHLMWCVVPLDLSPSSTHAVIMVISTITITTATSTIAITI
jgi:hypothetical protein